MKTLIKLEKHHCRNCDNLSEFLTKELNVEYTSYNIEEKPEKAAKYGAMSMPVLLLVDENDKVLDRVDGFTDREAVIELVERFKEEA
jgi:thioredoxin-related protein